MPITIESVRIKSFGGLSDREYNFGCGINIAEGDNETGKSTVASFIKFIFFGLEGRSEKGGISERAKYCPWGSAGMGGSLTVSDGDKRWRIERECGISARNTFSESVRVIDTATNTAIPNVDPAAMFIGVPEEVFVRSCYISQTDGNKINGADIHEAIENILFSADEATNTQRAMKKLDEARTALLYKTHKGGKIYELRKEQDILSERLAVARGAKKEIAEKAAEIAEQQKAFEANSILIKNLSAHVLYTDAARRLRQIDSMRHAEAKLAKAKEALEAHVLSNTRNGYAPDAEYANDIRRATIENRYAREELQRQLTELQELEADYGDLAFDDNFDDSTINEIPAKAAALKSRKTGFAVTGALLFLIAAAIGLFAFLRRAETDTLFIASAVAAVVLLCSVVILFVLGKNTSAKLRTLLSSVNAVSSDELIDIIAAVSEKKANALAAARNIDIARGKCDEAEQKEAKTRERCTELLSRWGVEVLCEDELDAALDATLIEAVAYCENDRELSAAVTVAEAEYSAVKISCGENEAESLRSVIGNGGTELSAEDYQKEKRELDFYAKTTSIMNAKLHQAERELTEQKARAESPDELEEKLKALSDEEKRLCAIHDAYLLAYEKLGEASVRLRGRIAPKLSEAASCFMMKATSGKYNTLGVDAKLGMEFSGKDSGTRNIAFLSTGTQDLAYLSLRLALADMLLGSKCPPLIFDESFARLDDKRLSASLAAIGEYVSGGKQAIIFTSQKRDAETMARLGAFTAVHM